MEKLSSFFKLSQMKWSEGGPLPLQRCGCASGSVQLKSPGCADFLLWRCCFLPGSTLAAHSGETGFLSCRSVWTDRDQFLHSKTPEILIMTRSLSLLHQHSSSSDEFTVDLHSLNKSFFVVVVFCTFLTLCLLEFLTKKTMSLFYGVIQAGETLKK